MSVDEAHAVLSEDMVALRVPSWLGNWWSPSDLLDFPPSTLQKLHEV